VQAGPSVLSSEVTTRVSKVEIVVASWVATSRVDSSAWTGTMSPAVILTEQY